MTLISHLNSLIQKHNNIEKSIKSANDNYNNEIEITRLKKEKLRIKEQIDAIEKEL